MANFLKINVVLAILNKTMDKKVANAAPAILNNGIKKRFAKIFNNPNNNKAYKLNLKCFDYPIITSFTLVTMSTNLARPKIKMTILPSAYLSPLGII